jgi:hypothetical protein
VERCDSSPDLGYNKFLACRCRRSIDAGAKDYAGFLAQVLAAIEACLPVQLLRGEVQVAVRADRKSVGPQYARIMHQVTPAPVRPEAVDDVVFIVTDVDVTSSIGLQPIRGAFVAQVFHRLSQVCL